MNHNIVKNPIWEETMAGYFTSVAEDLNSGLQRTNLASGQGGTGTYISSALTARPRAQLSLSLLLRDF